MIALSSRPLFGLSVVIGLTAITLVACASPDYVGRWVIDVDTTIARQAEDSLPALAPGLTSERVQAMARGLTVEFQGVDAVTLTKDNRSVTRTYSVIRHEGNIRSLAIHTDQNRQRRITIIEDKGNLVVLENHRKIILRRP